MSEPEQAPRPAVPQLAGIPAEPPGTRPGRHRKPSVLMRMTAASLVALAVAVVLIALTGTAKATTGGGQLMSGAVCERAELGHQRSHANGHLYICEQREGEDCPHWHWRPPCDSHRQPCRDHCQPCRPSCSPSPSPTLSPAPSPSVTPSQTTTPSESSAPSPSPTGVTSPSPSDTPPAVFVPPVDTGLPQTGAPVLGYLAAGAVLILAGVGVWVFGSRSRWVRRRLV